MVQRFSKLQRIDQGTAGPIGPVQLVQILAGNQKRSNPSALPVTLCVIADPHITQITAVAQKECPSKDVRGLKAGCIQ